MGIKMGIKAVTLLSLAGSVLVAAWQPGPGISCRLTRAFCGACRAACMQAGDTMQDRLHAACTGAFLRKSGFLLRSTSCRSARQLSPWTCASTEAAIALGDAQRLLENFDREQLRVAKEGFGGTREGFGGGTSAAKWAVAYPDWPALRKAVLALTDVSEQVFFDMLMKPRLWFHFGGSKRRSLCGRFWFLFSPNFDQIDAQARIADIE